MANIKNLNATAQAVMEHLVAGLTEPGAHRKLDHAPGVYMALSVECIGPNRFSLAHYGEQNGDLMADPEMTFWRDLSGRFYSASYRNDYVGVDREGLLFQPTPHGGPTHVRQREQRDETTFAGTWLRNIKAQQLTGAGLEVTS